MLPLPDFLRLENAILYGGSIDPGIRQRLSEIATGCMERDAPPEEAHAPTPAYPAA